jgi:hypothetical protein
MTQNEAAIPRNTCPLCWQLTRVPLLQFLPSRGKEKGFRCSSCNERIQVARSTQLIAYIGGLAALGAIVLAFYLLAPSLGSAGLLPRRGSPWAIVLPVGIIAMSAAVPIFAAPFARLALRLEPWVDETI